MNVYNDYNLTENEALQLQDLETRRRFRLDLANLAKCISYQGGVIVSTGQLTELQIAEAKRCGLLVVDENGLGFAVATVKGGTLCVG